MSRSFRSRALGKTVRALDGVSFEMPSGEISALIGPDGAGKTTLIRVICGIVRPDSGRLVVMGADVTKSPRAVQGRMGYMPQQSGLYDDLTVQENMDLYADIRGVAPSDRSRRASWLLGMAGLAQFTDRAAGRLSGGMKQKLALACALAAPSDILVLDEPTSGVDPLSRRELWEILRLMARDERMTVILSTPYMEEAALSGMVLVLNEGRVLFAGSPGDLSMRARGLCGSLMPEEGVSARALQSRLLDDGETIIDALPHGGGARFILRPGASLSDVRIEGSRGVASAEPRLEDGFMTLLLRPGASGPARGGRASPSPAVQGQAAGETVIEVRDLVRKFGPFTAVGGISFGVRRMEIFGLLGPNGSGKTTTFRMLCGLLPATGGFLRVAGEDLRFAASHARMKIGYVAQKFSLYGNLSVRENLRFFGGAYGLHGHKLRERIEEAVERFGLGEYMNERCSRLPGGFKQRAAMASALLHEPEILFLDEPTSGIDPLARRAFWRSITSLAASGMTVIVTTHFMEEAEYCDRIVILDSGSILAIGTPGEVREGTGGAPTMDEAFIRIVEDSRGRNAT
ncbi:MAG: ATP-binding cassette domain-containing protein [Synergistaceae bacterium]|nr:ATP-binding cassette domain-containing protein [Synergistaceae bacterium]